MKVVIIISVVTFVLIFGGVLLISNHLAARVVPTQAVAELPAGDQVAADRLLQDIDTERDRIQVQKEELLAMRQRLSLQQKMLADTASHVQELLQELQAEQKTLVAAKETSARKLAKMYEAMKPAKAAPILASLDLDVVLEILERMKERPAAKILSYLDPDLAAEISAQMSLKGAN